MNEAWIIIQSDKDPNKVAYKRLLQVEFTEPTMLEFIIRKSLEYNNRKNTSMWAETAKKRGLLVTPGVIEKEVPKKEEKLSGQRKRRKRR